MNDEQLVKYLLNELTFAERLAIKRWIEADPANTRYFEHFQLIWETSKKIAIPSSANTDDAWKRFKQRIEEPNKSPAKIFRINRYPGLLKAASVAILVIGIAFLAYYFSAIRSAAPVTVASTASPKNDSLPDGSIVMLNKNSTITYPKRFRGSERRIDLKGEAFFNVAPDRKKPFVVHVNDITVSVIGTSFNIKSTAGTTEVVVETGIVRVTKAEKTVELRPGEKLDIHSADSILLKKPVTDRLHQYYRSKQFVCDRTPLWKLVAVLNEAYDANISIARSEIRNLPLTTTFNNESLQKILSVIAETLEITVEQTNGTIILK